MAEQRGGGEEHPGALRAVPAPAVAPGAVAARGSQVGVYVTGQRGDDLQLEQRAQRAAVDRRPGKPPVAIAAEGSLGLVALGPLVVDGAAEVGIDVGLVVTAAELHERMAGLTGTKPFECTGTEDEVRAAIRAVGEDASPDDFPALATCLRNPAVITARPLAVLLTDWGRDDLVPDTLTSQIRKAVSRQPPTLSYAAIPLVIGARPTPDLDTVTARSRDRCRWVDRPAR